MGHTPGPWYANQDCVEIDGPEGPRDVTLAVVLQPDNADADARLIAAAPELLQRLRECVAWLEDYYDAVSLDDDQSQHLDAARAAIAKAEGTDEPDRRMD